MKKNLATAMAAAMAFGAVVPAFAAPVAPVLSANADVALSNGEISIPVSYDRAYETKFTPSQSDDVLREGITILDVISKDANDYKNNQYLVSIKVNKDNFKELKAEFVTAFTSYVDYQAFETAVKANKSDYAQAQADIKNYLNHTFTDNGVRKAKYKKVETERQAEAITGNVCNEVEVKLVNQQTTGTDLTFVFKNVKVEEASATVTPEELNVGDLANYKTLSEKVFELENKKDVTVKVKEKDASTLDIEVYKKDAKKTHISTLRLNNFNQFNKHKFIKIAGSNSDFAGHWAKDSIFEAMYSGKIDNAVNFRPEANITRAEFAKMLVNYLNVDTTGLETYKNPYTDIKEKTWEYDYVIALTKAGIVEGNGNGTFRPNDKISRQESAKMVASAARVLDLGAITGDLVNPTTGKHTDEKTSFRDDKTIAPWADNSIKQLSEKQVYVGGEYKNVVTGYADDTFRPENNITRAESISLMEKAGALIKGER